MVKQKSFPWMSQVEKPADAELYHVGMCKSASDALAISLQVSRTNVTARQVARYLGVSEATISQLKKGVRPILDWMVTPLCYATGSNLLQQYIDLQSMSLLLKEKKCDRERVEAIVYQIRRAA